MRKILLGLLVFIIIISPLYAGGNRWTNKPPLGSSVDWSNPLSRGLVGCWLMNERGGKKVIDLANNSQNSAFAGSRIVDQDGSAWASSNTTDRITIDRNSRLEPQQLSIVVLFKIRASSTYEVICDKAYTSHADPYYSYHLRVADVSSVFSSVVPNAYADANIIEFATSLTVNKAYYLVNTFDGTNNRLYLNGVLKATTVKAVTISYWNTPLIIGNFRNLDYGGSHNIYYLYIYNRALSPSEIRQLYQDPYCFIKPPTIWSMFSTAVAAARRFMLIN